MHAQRSLLYRYLPIDDFHVELLVLQKTDDEIDKEVVL